MECFFEVAPLFFLIEKTREHWKLSCVHRGEKALTQRDSETFRNSQKLSGHSFFSSHSSPGKLECPIKYSTG